jgi:hypothetical protein
MFYLPSNRNDTLRLEGFERPLHAPAALPDPVLMRRATAADADRIRVLARLDNTRVPEGPFLVADVAGEIVAALSLGSGVVVADPFRFTADAVAMLRLRAAQVGAERTAPYTAASATRALEPAAAA